MRTEDEGLGWIGGLVVLIVLAMVVVGGAFAAGWHLAPAHKVVTKKVEVVKEVEVPREKSRWELSTDACVAKGGVPTYSAWDGELNGCLGI